MNGQIQTEAYIALKPGDSPTLETIYYNGLQDNEILVEIAAFSVCASDLKAAKGAFHLNPPMILGHEGSGRVKRCGPAVRGLVEGDSVILSFCACKACPACLSGAAPYCEHIFALNFSGKRSDGSFPAADKDGLPLKGLFFGQSSMARLALVDARCAVKVDAKDQAELEMMAAIGCGIQTGAGAIFNVCRPPVGSRIAILGAGSVGVSAALAAQLHQPSLLTLIDNSDAKLKLLPPALSESPTVKTIGSAGFGEDQLTKVLKDSTDGKGYEYILECAGSPQLVTEAYKALAVRGTIVTVGGSSLDAHANIGINSQLVGGRTYRGTHQGDSVPSIFLPQLVELWRQGNFDVSSLVTRYGFNELDKALSDLKNSKIIKPILIARQ